MTSQAQSYSLNIFSPLVIITALGYMVDVYDLLLFNVVRVPSLTDLGLSGEALTDAGLYILNMQMTGLLIGGLAFGIAGDKIGRKSCLLVSILIYSLATLLCAFVQNADQYALLRFIAGLGLSGEVGIGISLITESLARERRGLATTLFCFIGIMGAVLAAVAASFLEWRTCYLIGGLAGLALLATRALICESELFSKLKACEVSRGNLMIIFKKPILLRRYIACILVGVPIYYAIGVLWTLAPELGKAMGMVDAIKPAMAVGIGYTGLVIGDAIAGTLSQVFKSRIKPLLLFLTATGVVLVTFFFSRDLHVTEYYAFCLISGLTTGYWVNMATLAAEQFGTNIRATAATSIPNFVRATLLPMNLVIAALKPELGIAMAALIVGGVALVIALLSMTQLEETFAKDLDYHD